MSRLEARSDDPTYYDVPVVKEPVWIWAVPAYFYTGGVAGAAGVLAAVSQATGDEELEGLVRRCRDLATAGTTVGTALLIYDLGRPERFLNMLRVFRVTSPMSVGSWVLSAATGAAVAASAASRLSGPLGWLARPATYALGALGGPLAGYSAVLVGNTAMPVWQDSRRTLPPLFVGSAMASLASLLELLPATSGAEEKAVERFGRIGKGAELAGMFAVQQEASRLPEVGAPYREGVSGVLWAAAKAMTIGSLALSFAARRSRRLKVAGAVLGTGGALAMRFSVFYAGQRSARDPQATFRRQRAAR